MSYSANALAEVLGMRVALIIASLFLGFIGFMLDGSLSQDMPIFTVVLFLLPSVWAIGSIYDNLPSIIAKEIAKEESGDNNVERN